MTTTKTIGERFGNSHNPCLTRNNETGELYIQSKFSCCDYETIICEFGGVDDFCDGAGDCSPDTELTDAEWDSILAGMADI